VLAFVALPLLLAAGWLQYRDPSLAVHITRAAVGANARLWPDAAPLFEEPSRALQSPRLLQYLHTARAWRERERSGAEPVEAETVKAEPVKAAPVKAGPVKVERRPRAEPVAIPYPVLVPPEPAPSVASSPPVQASAPPPAPSMTEPPTTPRPDDSAKQQRDTEERYGL
jgi:hypothetical protein